LRIERNLTDLYTGLVPELDSISDTTLGKLAVLPLPGCGSKTKLVIPLYRVNHLPPNGHYTGRTAQLTSRCYILYIYSTNIRTEYFKHAA